METDQPDQPHMLCLGEPMVEIRLHSDEAAIGIGGDMLNVAARLAAENVSSTLAYVRSSDVLAEWMARKIEALGVQTTFRFGDGTTGIYSISTGETGERDFSYWREGSAASSLSASDVDIAASGCNAIMLSGITQALSEGARAAVREAARQASSLGVLTVYDPNVRVALWSRGEGLESARESASEILGLVDVFVPSFEDCHLLWGVEDPRDIPSAIPEFSGRLIVTSGEEGAWLFEDGGPRLTPAKSLGRVVDTTGAGDAFTAGLMVGLLNGDELSASVARAIQTAASTVLFPGALTDLTEEGQPRRGEVS